VKIGEVLTLIFIILIFSGFFFGARHLGLGCRKEIKEFLEDLFKEEKEEGI